MSNKQLVIETVQEMAEEASMEEILENIAILAAIRRGEEAADEGRVISHDELQKRIASWIGK
jgi:predicted transcriptional regulator